MDLSKLPKLSGEANHDPDPLAAAHAAQSPPPPTRPPSTQPMAHGAEVFASPVSAAANAWISLIIGLLLLYMGRTFAAFVIATLSHKPFDTGVAWVDGVHTGEVPYFQLQGYTAWTDAAMFLFGLVLLFDGAVWVLAATQPGRMRLALWPAAVLTAIGTLFNAVVALLLFSSGIVPLMSIVAVAVGGWVFLDQWRLLRATSIPRATLAP